MAECFLEIRWINIHPGRCNDYILSAPFEIEISLLIDRTQVAGPKPTFITGDRHQLLALPVCLGDVLAPHQDLAAFIKLHLATGKDFADRLAPQLEWMVHRDEGSALGESIALDYDKAQPPPELLGHGVEGGASRDEGPELPAKEIMNLAKAPPASNKLLFLCSRKLFLEPGPLSLRLEIALDLLFHCFDHARHGYNYRNPL